jgi:hypothetical protein
MLVARREPTALFLERLVLSALGGLVPGAGALREDVWPDNAPRDDDEETWSPLSLGDSAKALEPMSLERAVKQSRDLYLHNAHARGLIENALKFIAGTEPGEDVRFNVLRATDLVEQKLLDFWEEWAEDERNEWRLLSWEIVERALRDGECFLRVFDAGRSNFAFRFIDPLDVKDPSGRVTYGIETKPEDAATPVAYYVLRPDGQRADRIGAKNVIHIKIGVDSDVKRGIPYLYIVHQRLRRYDKFVDARLILGQLRSALALLREHKTGGAAGVQAFADAHKTGEKTQVVSGTSLSVRRQLWRPGTIIDTTPNVRYEFLEPKTASEDAAADARMALLSIAAGTGQPSYMVTNDTTRANYASTTIEERLGVKEFGKWQAFFAVYFRRIWGRVVAWGVRTKRLPAEAGRARVEVKFPRIKTRNPVDESTADEKYVGIGAMSRQTAAERAGLDWSKERRRLEIDQEDSISRMPPMPARGAPAAGEHARLLALDQAHAAYEHVLGEFARGLH